MTWEVQLKEEAKILAQDLAQELAVEKAKELAEERVQNSVQQNRLNTAQKMLNMNFSPEQIAQITDLSFESVMDLANNKIPQTT